jgi:hypothetical protein
MTLEPLNERDLAILRLFDKARDKVFSSKGRSGRTIFEIIRDSEEFKKRFMSNEDDMYEHNAQRKIKQLREDSYWPEEKEHISSMTTANLKEQAMREFMESQLWDLIEGEMEPVLQENSYFKDLDTPYYNDIGIVTDESNIKGLVESALLRKLLTDPAPVMPEKVYRGNISFKTIPTDNGKRKYNPEIDGFGVMDENDPDEYLSFVTDEPEIAASYHRRIPFSRHVLTHDPTSLGDYVYEILTKGLDPALFQRDQSATLSEALFGPQFVYKGRIPQEDVEVTDSAGNTRIVPRIQKGHFGSDKRLKRVITPGKHIVDALRTKY